jgi:hypothetical protein
VAAGVCFRNQAHVRTQLGIDRFGSQAPVGHAVKPHSDHLGREPQVVTRGIRLDRLL